MQKDAAFPGLDRLTAARDVSVSLKFRMEEARRKTQRKTDTKQKNASFLMISMINLKPEAADY